MRLLNYWSPRLFVGFIIVLPFFLFWRWLFKGEVLFWGTLLLQFWPWHYLAKASILAGEWPLWNPLLGNGTPLMANLQTALFYPLNLLYLLVPVEHGLTISVILHLILAGLFMHRYTRFMGLSNFAATLSALTYMLSGYIVGRTQFIPMVNAAAWLPLLLLLSEKIATRPARLDIIWLAVALAVQLSAGHAQLWFYSLWLIGGYAVFRSWQTQQYATDTPRLSPTIRRIIGRLAGTGWRLGVAVSLAMLLAAVQLLPTAEFAAQSPRGSGAERNFALTYSFWPWRLITLAAPDFFGNPATGDYWGYANYWEDHAYLGVLPLLLALAAIWYYYRQVAPALRRYRKEGEKRGTDSPSGVKLLYTTPFFAVLVPLSLILAMGWNTPVYLWIFDTAPGFNFFQAPARLLIWYTVAMAVLAGLGAQFFEIAPHNRRPWRRVLMACAGITAATAIASFVLEGRSRTFLAATLTLGLLLIFSILLWLKRPKLNLSPPGQNAVWQWLVIGFVALDLLKSAVPLNPTLPAAIFTQNIASATFLKSQPGHYRYYVEDSFDYGIKFYRYFHFQRFGPLELAYWQGLKETLIPNLNVYTGLSTSNNYDPLVVKGWRRLMEQIRQANESQRAQLIAVMNAGYVIAGANKDNPSAVYQNEDIAIAQAFEPLPRAYFVRQAYVVEDESAAAARLTSANFDSRQEVIIMVTDNKLIEQIPESLIVSGNSAGQGRRQGPDMATVTITEQAAGRVALAVEAPAAGFVVLTDTFYPGWQVTVDQQPAELWPANLAFRAVMVEAGFHEVVFSYRPRSFTVGLWISVITLLVLVVAGGFITLYRKDS